MISISNQLMQCSASIASRRCYETIHELLRTVTKRLTEMFFLSILCIRFVDAKGYMATIADAILRAEEEIFITDWW